MYKVLNQRTTKGPLIISLNVEKQGYFHSCIVIELNNKICILKGVWKQLVP